MTEAGKKYLADILMAITLIEDFTQETVSFAAYQSVKRHLPQLKKEMTEK